MVIGDRKATEKKANWIEKMYKYDIEAFLLFYTFLLELPQRKYHVSRPAFW